MTNKLFPFALSFCFFLLAAETDAATIQNETLQTPALEGFMAISDSQNTAIETKELVPADETDKTWSRKITIQTLRTSNRPSADRFATSIAEQWRPVCPGGDVGKFKEGSENGYSFSLWMFTCPLTAQPNKPENIWLKVITGNDALYAVQYAFHKKLTRTILRVAVQYLRQVIVCDDRLPARVCPPAT